MVIRLRFLILVSLIGIHHERMLGAHEEIYLKLCVNEDIRKIPELLKDLLEWHLLLIPYVTTGSCLEVWPGQKPFVFRQEARLVGDVGDKRYQITNALYDENQRPIFSQIEFIEITHRQVMVDRAAVLVPLLLDAMHAKKDAYDPFSQQENQPISMLVEKIPEPDADKGVLPVFKASYKGEFFIGMERSGQSLHGDFLADTKDQVLTRSYPIVGMSFEARPAWPLMVKTSVRGAFIPIELLRPMRALSDTNNDITMFDATIDPSWVVVDNGSFYFDIGVSLAVNYFKLPLLLSINSLFIDRYWQLKEGVISRISYHFSLLDSSLGFVAGFYPFVHNFAEWPQKPQMSFAWLLGVDAQSTLYRDIAVKLSFYHHGEYFDFLSTSKQSIVSHGTLAYLSLVFKI